MSFQYKFWVLCTKTHYNFICGMFCSKLWGKTYLFYEFQFQGSFTKCGRTFQVQIWIFEVLRRLILASKWLWPTFFEAAISKKKPRQGKGTMVWRWSETNESFHLSTFPKFENIKNQKFTFFIALHAFYCNKYLSNLARMLLYFFTHGFQSRKK